MSEKEDKSKQKPSRKLEACIDCGNPVAKASPLLGRICECRDDHSG